MKYWYFSECAYPDLPSDDSYESIRVKLPNGLMDPVKAADLWHRYLDEWQAAEGYGIGLMLNEHHQTPTCMNPAVPIVAGILARTTTTARILVLGNPVANRTDPVRVAEEMALVDIISRGRIECGLVRGVPYEVAATNSKPINMSERFWEAHDLIVKAWTTHDGPFSWTGDFFEHRQVNIWPRPYQQPHPPIWITTTTPSSAPKVADYGYTLATFLMGKAGAKPIFQSYRDRRSELGLDMNPERLAYCALVFVGENAQEAERGAELLMWYLRSNKSIMPFEAPPGYMPPEARLKIVELFRQIKTLSRETLIERGLMFSGTPDQVFNQIKSFRQHVGDFGHLLMMGQAGFLGTRETINSLRLFSQEVAPRIAELESTPVDLRVA